MSAPRRKLFALFSAAAIFSGCSERVEYAPYEGPAAFPNRRPQHAAEGRRLGYVSNSLSDTISIVDLDRFELIAEAPVGRDPVDLDGPHHLSVDRERGLIYVALSYPVIVERTGPHAGHGNAVRFGYVQQLDLLDLRPLAEARVEPNPGDIVRAPSQDVIAITHYDRARAETETSLEAKRAALILFEPASELDQGAERTRIPVCVAPHGLTFSADASRVFVACTGEDSVAVVDRSSNSVVARVPVADGIGSPGRPLLEPYAAVLDPTGTTLAISNIGANSLVLFRVGEELERLTTTPLLGPAYFPAWVRGGSHLIVPFQSPAGAVLIEASTGRIEGEAQYAADDCRNPHEVVLLDEERAALLCEGDHLSPGTLCALDPATLELGRCIPLGIFPDRLVVVDP